MKKRGILIAGLVVGMTITVSAFTQKAISAEMKSQAIYYKGNTTNQEVIEYNNTTYVPLRKFSELVGVPVDYKNGSIYLGNSSNHISTNNAGTVTNGGSDTYIDGTKAKYIALEHAGVAESSVTIVKVKMERENRRVVYEVEFYVGNKEYDYEIDAITGEIVSYDYDIEGFEISSIGNNGDYIGKEKAEQIALNHAQLTKQQVRYVQNELDRDDGRWEYQVEFRSGNKEYDYEIDAYTGEITNFSIDRD